MNNNIDFKITNNNYFSALPDCLTLILKQFSENICKIDKNITAKKVLGKRKRR